MGVSLSDIVNLFIYRIIVGVHDICLIHGVVGGRGGADCTGVGTGAAMGTG